jgi:hypothetical protein
MNEIQSAIAYLSSKKAEIEEISAFDRMAAKIKADIQSGVFGDMLKHPEPTPPLPDVADSVADVNELRGQGMTLKEACEAMGVDTSTHQSRVQRLRANLATA